MGRFLFAIVDGALGLIVLAIFASVIMSWLIAFNVINRHNDFVRQIDRFLFMVTQPFLWPFRRVIPPLGAVDISPLIALLVIQAARSYLLPWVFAPIIVALGG
jgi:YggT family protein